MDILLITEFGKMKEKWSVNKGLIIYTPKKLSEAQTFEKKKSELDFIHESSRIALLRLLLKIKSPLTIKAKDAEGRVIAGDSDD